MQELPPLEPIPTPSVQRWREFRLLYLPRTVFVVGAIVAAWLWSHTVAPATIVAEADTPQAEVRCVYAGVLTSLTVENFEPVHAGQVVGQVTLAGPRMSVAAPSLTLGEAAAKTDPAAGATIALVAPMDGVVSVLLRHQGEMLAAGETVLRITSRRASRLTAYLRQPVTFEPQVGMIAEIRTRGTLRRSAITKVTSVGAAMEAIPPSLLAAMHVPPSAGSEHALRLHLAMPKGLELRPGEHVDVIIH